MKIRVTKKYEYKGLHSFKAEIGDKLDVAGFLDHENYYLVENNYITNKLIPKDHCQIIHNKCHSEEGKKKKK